MYDAMIGNWWAIVLRGGIAALFGLLVLVMPGLTLGDLVSLFAAFALADGLIALFLGWRARGDFGARLLLLDGLSSIALGLVALVWSDISAMTLLLLLGVRALATGATQLAAGLRIRRDADGDWLIALTGAVALLFGVLFLVLSGVGTTAVLWWIALYALAVGALQVVAGLRLRAVSRESHGGDGMMAAA